MIVVVILLLRGDFMLSYKQLIVVNKELLVRIKNLKNQLIKKRSNQYEKQIKYYSANQKSCKW